MKKSFIYIGIALLLLSISPNPGGTEKVSGGYKDSSSVTTKLLSIAQTQLDSMSLEEKIGQLFMIAAYSNKDKAHENAIEKAIREHHIGGLIFMQGGPERQKKLIQHYQHLSKYPLLIAQDAEWGPSMRLDSVMHFPKNMTLGAIEDNMLLFELGMEVGRQCKLLGVDMNFAPVVDVNNNPANPIINDRSFGEDKENVANKGIYFAKGMEYMGVMGCAKHFPGHGDTEVDSHKELPQIPFSRKRLDSLELYPFKKMIAAGIPAVMVAHLYIPELDSSPHLASTLSPKIVNDLLKKELGFNGLSFTDALNMKGVTKYFPDGETDEKAFLAGNDVLLFSGDVPKAAALIKTAIEEDKVTEAELNKRVLKILVAKAWAGLHKPTAANRELNDGESFALRKKLYREALTLVKNTDSVFPVRVSTRDKIACVEIGGKPTSAFAETLKKYREITCFYLPSQSGAAERQQLLNRLKDYKQVIIGLDGMNKYLGKKFGISESTRQFIRSLNASERNTTVHLCIFGSPYALQYFGPSNSILVAYENHEDAKEAAAEAVFGAIPTKGTLPVTASEQFPAGTGLVSPTQAVLCFSSPEAVGMDSKTLARIDSIAEAAIDMKATPGCAVLVMRGQHIVYHKAFGRTEYTSGRPVHTEKTLYDLASVTKVASTTLAAMKLYEDKVIDLEAPITIYLPELREKKLAHIKVKNLLLHNSGFRSWIPFYQHTFQEENAKAFKDSIYASSPTDYFCVPVTAQLYMCKNYQDSIWFQIVNSSPRQNAGVRYSDLNMIILKRILEAKMGKALNRYVDSVFYQPLGMSNTHFTPALTAPQKYCAPTEIDNYWRKTKVQGYVHDQAAAMLGGWSGHAGLFSTVYDLAKLAYMLQNDGHYGGRQFFEAGTIRHFTQKQLTGSRRGLGWDKAEMDTAKTTPCAQYASEFTFGHSGFTGIGFWMDPQYDLTFVFLSNRTFPDAGNKKLIREGIRTEMQDVMYEAIFNYEQRAGNEPAP